MRFRSHLAVAVGCGILAAAESASAVVLTWDIDTGTAGAQGGTGTWNTANGLWLNTTPANQNWANSNDAVFGSPGGIVRSPPEILTMIGELNVSSKLSRYGPSRR